MRRHALGLTCRLCPEDSRAGCAQATRDGGGQADPWAWCGVKRRDPETEMRSRPSSGHCAMWGLSFLGMGIIVPASQGCAEAPKGVLGGDTLCQLQGIGLQETALFASVSMSGNESKELQGSSQLGRALGPALGEMVIFT